MHSQINFGYPWYLSYGHAVFALPFLLLAWRFRNKTARALCALLAFWALSSSAIMLFGFNIQSRASLPTPNFLTSGTGKVLDIGAGTGRSALMVLESRPNTTVVALDEFGDSFQHHFGHSAESLLLANAKAAGVDSRVTIQKADMRKMPFEADTFDALVSAYAIDHVGRRGIEATMAEAFRVLKPGGEFLFIVNNPDLFTRYALGPVLIHNRMRGFGDWKPLLTAPGFQIVEHGTPIGTLYVLLRKPAVAP